MCRMSYLDFMRRWRLWIRPLVIVVYVLALTILLPVLVINAYNKGFTKSDQGSLIGGLFVMMALPISLWEIIQHMVHYHRPFLQKHIIRILWMVPIYALNAWLGLVFPSQSIYMDSLRECYEAYVIYNFMVYLLNYLNSETNLVASLELKPQVKHFFPFCFLPPWEMGREFVHMCKHGILQYTVIRPLTSAISFMCELNGVYGEGQFTAGVAFPYMIFINNLSQFIAMYCLVLFYRANREELRPMKPVGKFLCIKAVVFFSFFQGVIISILVYTGVISSIFGTEADPRLVASKLQDFLICIEMFLAAVAHHYSFSYKPFVPHKEDREIADVLGCWDAFTAMWDVSDVHRDLREHIGVVGSSLSRSIRGQQGYKALPTENSGLLVVTEEQESGRSYSALTHQAPSSSGAGDERDWTRRASIDQTATEADKFVATEKEKEQQEASAASGRGIPVDSPDERLIDLAPEVDFSSQKSGTPIA